MKIKYLFYILFSCPGIIIHEFSHQLFCSLSGVRVFKVKYFQLKNPAGYVEHAQPRNFIQAFFISVGPFIFGTILAFLLFFFTIYPFAGLMDSIISPQVNQTPTDHFQLYNFTNFITAALAAWFGFSISLNCFPSSGDAKVLLLETNRHVLHRFNPFAIIFYPFVFIIKIANYLKRFYFDWIYAIFILALAVYVALYLLK